MSVSEKAFEVISQQRALHEFGDILYHVTGLIRSYISAHTKPKQQTSDFICAWRNSDDGLDNDRIDQAQIIWDYIESSHTEF